MNDGCTGALQGLVPILRGPDSVMQRQAVSTMLQVARDESSFDAIDAAGILSCCAAPLYKLAAQRYDKPKRVQSFQQVSVLPTVMGLHNNMHQCLHVSCHVCLCLCVL